MPEEKIETAPVAPAPEQAAAPAAPVAAAPKKRSNTGVIILIVILAILIIGGGISYGIYRFVKNRVNNVVTDAVSTAGVNTDFSNAGTDTSDFSAVKDTTPNEALPKSVNDSIKPILKRLFGDAKLSIWSSVENGGTLMYTTRDKIETDDYNSLQAAIVSAGYTQDSVYSSSEALLVYYTKGDVAINVATTSNSTNEISVIISQNTPVE